MLVNTVAVIGCERPYLGVETLGEKVKRLRGRRPMDRIAREAGLTRDVIWRLETGRTPSPRWDTIERLAKALSLTTDELLEGTSVGGTIATDETSGVPGTESAAESFGSVDAFLEAHNGNVKSISNADIYVEPPTFNLGVAAGGWVEVCEQGMPEDGNSPAGRAMIVRGEFRVYVNGDSMEPDWPNKSRVTFRIMSEFEDFIVGEPYYVQRDDCYATFKEVAEVHDDHIVLRALNSKYPDPMPVKRDRIVRAAMALHYAKDPRAERKQSREG